MKIQLITQVYNFIGIAYGHEVTENDRFVSLVETGTKKMLSGTFPGAAVLNALPFRS
jgi:hypothetical protein